MRYFIVSVQQSAAFKILRTRLETVPSINSNNEQLRRSQIPQLHDDCSRNQDAGNTINFAHRLQQFTHMQHQHRRHAKSQLQSRISSSSRLSQVSNILPVLSDLTCQHLFLPILYGNGNGNETLVGSHVAQMQHNAVCRVFDQILNSRLK